MRAFFLFLALIIFEMTKAQNYYLSQNGNDNWDGRSAKTAWKSLTKLQNVSKNLQPGDSVLFERGSVFTGSLNVESSGKPGQAIYIGAYGEGPKPVIKGTIQQKNWVALENNIWTAVCDSCDHAPADLFVNDTPQPLGRFPNNGYRMATISSSNKRGFFVDSSTGLIDTDWRDAEIVIKSRRWLLDRFKVKSYRNAIFEVELPVSYKQQEKSPYFIQNHLSTLDEQGEWCFESKTKKIYLFSTRKLPIKFRIDLSLKDVGLIIKEQHDIVVENISFTKFRNVAVQFANTSAIVFKNNEISFAGFNGLEVTSSVNTLVENNIIRDINNNGIVWEKNDNGIFRDNKILRIALRPGRGKSGDGAYIALFIKGDTRDKKNVIEKNVIDSIGYSAIDFRTGSTFIKNNVVSNFCLIKDDGGGIYTSTNSYGQNIIDENIILGRKHPQSAHYKEQVYSYGIYIDDRSKDISISNNTIAYCSVSGIFVHNANNLVINQNTLLGNGENFFHKEKGQLLFRRDGLAAESEWDIQQMRIMKNKLISTREDQYALYLNFYRDQTALIGSLRNNQYIITRATSMAARDHKAEAALVCEGSEEYQLSDWQKLTGEDQGSTVKLISTPYLIPIGNNLVQNGDMTNGVQKWIIWPAEASIGQDVKAMSGPSLKVDIAGNTSSVLLYYAGLQLKPTTIYRLIFSVKAKESTFMEFVPMMAGAPYKALSDYQCVKINPVIKTFALYFTVVNNTSEARLNFKSNTTFWIDDVILQEMKATNGEQVIQLLYNDSNEPRKFSVANREPIIVEPYAAEVLTLQR